MGQWLLSYLQDRTHRIAIGSVLSDEFHLQCGVPQGSVLGPNLYCIFSKPIAEIFRRHNMSYHFYADDTQLYHVFEPLENWIDISKRPEDSLTDISSWMCSNMLKLNEDKTEVMLFAPKHRVKDLQDCHLTFGGNVVTTLNVLRILVFTSIKHYQWTNRLAQFRNPAFTKYEILAAYVRISQNRCK